MSTPSLAQLSFLYLGGTSLARRGKSRMCPMDDSTMYSGPRKAAMVFAFAGDSTMTRDLSLTGIGILGTRAGTVTSGISTCQSLLLRGGAVARQRRHPPAAPADRG